MLGLLPNPGPPSALGLLPLQLPLSPVLPVLLRLFGDKAVSPVSLTSARAPRTELGPQGSQEFSLCPVGNGGCMCPQPVLVDFHCVSGKGGHSGTVQNGGQLGGRRA